MKRIIATKNGNNHSTLLVQDNEKLYYEVESAIVKDFEMPIEAKVLKSFTTSAAYRLEANVTTKFDVETHFMSLTVNDNLSEIDMTFRLDSVEDIETLLDGNGCLFYRAKNAVRFTKILVSVFKDYLAD